MQDNQNSNQATTQTEEYSTNNESYNYDRSYDYGQYSEYQDNSLEVNEQSYNEYQANYQHTNYSWKDNLKNYYNQNYYQTGEYFPKKIKLYRWEESYKYEDSMNFENSEYFNLLTEYQQNEQTYSYTNEENNYDNNNFRQFNR